VDGWDPETDFKEKRSHELDQWIVIKLERLKITIYQEMEEYQLSRTVPPLLSFIDDLTNWYIRRSRRRFWKTENDEGKYEAYSTLYQVLLELSKVAAPFLPFLSDHIYQNLKLDQKIASKDSVHLEDYPLPREITKEEEERERAMDLTRSVVGLGRELREKLRIKIRQPLSKLFVGVVHAEDLKSLSSLLSIVQEELNVRDIEFHPFSEMASWDVKPNFKVLGKKLGPKLKSFQSECQTLEDDRILALLDGKEIEVLGETYAKDSFLIELKAKATFEHEAHSAGSLVIGLDTHLTEDLKREGLSRELVNRVQRFRKDAGLDVENRIELAVKASDDLVGAFSANRSLIESETLSTLSFSEISASMYHQTEQIDGQDVQIGIQIKNA
jgi:isoleucyl-tRNA synthetase